MKFKCFVLLGLFVSVHSASIYSKPIDIPVEVIYSEEIPYETRIVAKTQSVIGRRNLNEKIQLSPTELRQLQEFEDEPHLGNPNSIKNLDAKVQLSPEDLLQAEKHLPFLENEDLSVDVKSSVLEENAPMNVESTPNQDVSTEGNKVQSTEKSQPETAFVSLGESSTQKDVPTEPSVPISTTEENLPDPNVVLLIQIAQNIVTSGLTNIRENIDNLGNSEDGNQNPSITSEQWDRLNQTITDFFTNLLDRGTFKGNRDSIVNDIVSGVRGVTNNFVESLRAETPNAPPANATQTQRPGVGQNILNLITSGIQRITTSLNNIRNRTTTASTVLGEKEQSTTPARPFQNIVNQVGDTINNLNPFNQASTAAPGSQADTGSTQGNPFQNFANQVGQVVNNLNPFNQGSTQAPGAQNEGTTQGGPIQNFQNAFNQIGQVVNNIFNQGSTGAPGAQNEGTTGNPGGPIQQAFQNVVNVFGNIVNPSTSAPGSQNEESTTQGGPFQGAQNFINQIGQNVQNAFNQIGQAASTGNPLNQGSTSSGNNPVQGIQNVINQAGQAVSTLNPFNQGSSSSNPVEGIQNAINQAGQAVSTLNPLNQGSNGGNPVEGIQNAINQAGQVASTFNPLNQGSTSAGNNPLQGIQNAVSQAVSTITSFNQRNSTPPPKNKEKTDGVARNQDQEQQLSSSEPVGLSSSTNAISETTPGIESASTQSINPPKQLNPEDKAKDSFSDQEIMIAMD